MDRRSLRSAGKDGGWCPTRPRLLVAIRGCRQALRWCRGSCQSMPLRPRPKPRHHPANRWARRLNERLGGFGMCNAPCGKYRIPARKCRHGARHYPVQFGAPADHRDRATGRLCGGSSWQRCRAPARFEAPRGRAGRRVANNVTMPNRHALESGRSMTFRCHRRGRYIVFRAISPSGVLASTFSRVSSRCRLAWKSESVVMLRAAASLSR
jgi:hypothetical protein